MTASTVPTTACAVCPECPQHGLNFPVELTYHDHGAECPNCGRWWTPENAPR